MTVAELTALSKLHVYVSVVGLRWRDIFELNAGFKPTLCHF
jgi:hypothetical protein